MRHWPTQATNHIDTPIRIQVLGAMIELVARSESMLLAENAKHV